MSKWEVRAIRLEWLDEYNSYSRWGGKRGEKGGVGQNFWGILPRVCLWEKLAAPHVEPSSLLVIIIIYYLCYIWKLNSLSQNESQYLS